MCSMPRRATASWRRFSLMNLWSLHSGIVMANTMARMPSPKLQGLKALNQNILVESAYLAEA